MADWQLQLSYAVFYRAVYYENTNYHQYENTNILMNGVRLNVAPGAPKDAVDQAKASRLCQGIRPIAKAKASELGGLPDSELVRRVQETSIIDIDMAAHCLVTLLTSGHINMDDTHRRELLAIPYKENAARFLAAVFRLAAACPGTLLKPLTPGIQADIEACRKAMVPEQTVESIQAPLAAAGLAAMSRAINPAADEDSDRENTRQKDEKGITPMADAPIPFAKYTFRELQYNQDKQYVKENLLVLKDCEPQRVLTEAEIYA